MSTHRNRLRVGVTIGIRKGQQSLWENGIGQNCIFLAMLLQRSPAVESVVLINASGLTEVSPAMMLGDCGIRMIPLAESGELDVIIEMGAQLPDNWVADFRKRGGKYAGMRVGNDYAIDIERTIFNLSPGSLCTGKTFDAVWTIPGHEKSCADYFAITTRSEVTIVPHIWSPHFFRKGIDSLPEGLSYGYRPGREHWRVCTFEPNINMVKTSFLPMMVCEEAYRLEPRYLEFYRVCNTLHLKERHLMVRTALALDIVNHGLTTFEGRSGIYDFMARQGDCIVSHQWGCPQNYLYYEAIYGRYPLIHNSELLRDHGYYYPDFDCQEGGRVLAEAFRNHDRNLEEYERKCARLVADIDIVNPDNIEAYTRELLRLYGVQSGEELRLPDRPIPEVPTPSGAPIAEGIDKAWVVNLDRRPDRMEGFAKSHPFLAGQVTRHPAVDGKKLSLTPAVARLFKNNRFGWKKSAMGCALSHLTLWSRLASEPTETTWLVLEDDVRLLPGWSGRWEEALRSGSLPPDWDILFLGGILPPNRSAFEANIEKLNAHVARIAENNVFGQNPPNRYFHFCTYAYLISRRGALKLLERIRKHDGIQAPIDHVMCNVDRDNLGVHFLNPLVAGCFQDDDPAYKTGNFNADTPVAFDSDLRNAADRFTEEELRPFDLDQGLPLEIGVAIRETASLP